jgi:hypothetical protein
MDDFFAELNREIAKGLRHGTWPAYIVRALLPRPNYTEKQDVLKEIESDCERRGRSKPRTFKDVIQAAFEAHNSESDVFKAGNADLFFFAGMKGDGKWGLHVDCAKAWMAKRGYDLD